MFPPPISHSNYLPAENHASFSYNNNSNNNSSQIHPHKSKKKRNLPGNPDPDAEVIALSPNTLLATNRFVCEVCSKGFQRDQNLQLHRRGHNLPWKLKQRSNKESKKRAYVCPESTCLHHHPSRALGDLTGIKKHYCRKHGEKKWKCEKCSKIYAVQSDWKAHVKTCGTREYRCNCGTLFSRKDSFITHRAFCDALAEESARFISASAAHLPSPPRLLPFSGHHHHWNPPLPQNPNPVGFDIKHEPFHVSPVMMPPPFHVVGGPPPLSATALLQRAAVNPGMGHVGSTMAHSTRDFLGLTGNTGDQMVSFTGDVFGFGGNPTCSGWDNC